MLLCARQVSVKPLYCICYCLVMFSVHLCVHYILYVRNNKQLVWRTHVAQLDAGERMVVPSCTPTCYIYTPCTYMLYLHPLYLLVIFTPPMPTCYIYTPYAY